MHFIEFGIAFGGLLWSVLIIVCGLPSLLSHIYYKVNLYVPQIELYLCPINHESYKKIIGYVA